MMGNANVNLLKLKYYDSWALYLGTLYLVNKTGDRRAINFQFNGWGMQNSLMLQEQQFVWDYAIDNQVAIAMAKASGLDYYTCPLVLEGGSSIHTDGEGTLYTTEECLLNSNRNPNLTKDEIEEYLKQYLNVEKIIWIPRGMYSDETRSHINNLLYVVEPGLDGLR